VLAGGWLGKGGFIHPASVAVIAGRAVMKVMKVMK
jgi:hypothetical protein